MFAKECIFRGGGLPKRKTPGKNTQKIPTKRLCKHRSASWERQKLRSTSAKHHGAVQKCASLIETYLVINRNEYVLQTSASIQPIASPDKFAVWLKAASSDLGSFLSIAAGGHQRKRALTLYKNLQKHACVTALDPKILFRCAKLPQRHPENL